MDPFEIIEITDSESNFYEILHRLSCQDLKRLQIKMTQSQYKIYNLVRLQKCGNFGYLESYNKMGFFGLQPILESFPSLIEGLAFIESFQPGFRYSRKFREYLNNKIKKTTTPLASGESVVYKLDNYAIIVDTRTGPGGTTIRTRFYKDGKLHRIDGAAEIILRDSEGIISVVNEYYYENGININLL